MDHTIHEYPTNNVFVAIGQVSQNDLFKSLVETDDHGFIITNDKMETSLPGLFAIGDTRKKTSVKWQALLAMPLLLAS